MTPTPIPWPTPTQMPFNPATPPFDLGGAQTGYELAESIVAGYGWLNANSALDYLFLSIMILIVIGGLWSIIQHVKRLP